MTVVGDVAQTGSAAGVTAWAEVLEPYVSGRWRQEELTVNYRTPAQIMAAAAAVLAAAGVDARVPESVRTGHWPPLTQQVSGALDGVVTAGREELDLLDGGRLAVITPRATVTDLSAALAAGLPAGMVGAGRAALDPPVSVLTATEAKGLEFDAVVLYEPAVIVADSPRGVHDLYVAMTRPTKRLRVLHTGSLPPGLDGLTAR